MKKIYLIALCGAICLPAAADGMRFKTAAGKKKASRLRKEAPAPIWRPVSQTEYMYDGNDWMMLGRVEFTYDKRGNSIEESVDVDGYMSKTVYTYDEYDQVLTRLETESSDGGETWENVSRREYEYDSRVHDFFTSRMSYAWNDGKWETDFRCETNTITRNTNGNITEIVKSLPLGTEMKPAYRSLWTYDQATGKAVEYVYYEASGEGDDPWVISDDTFYKNIEWEKTDGQMTIDGDLLDLCEGDNLIKSAVVYYRGEADGHYLVSYSDSDLFGCVIKETTNDINTVGRITQLETLDANGSVRLTTTEYFDEDGNIGTEPTYISIQEAIADSHRNYVSQTLTEVTDGVEELVEGETYAYTYDTAGNPTEVVVSFYDYDSEEYIPDQRIVYGEYIDVTSGICPVALTAGEWNIQGDKVAVTADELTGISIYSTQGVKVASATGRGTSAIDISALPTGIYLVRADGTSLPARRIVKR